MRIPAGPRQRMILCTSCTFIVVVCVSTYASPKLTRLLMPIVLAIIGAAPSHHGRPPFSPAPPTPARAILKTILVSPEVSIQVESIVNSNNATSRTVTAGKLKLIEISWNKLEITMTLHDDL